MTQAILNGHKPTLDDRFKRHRRTLKRLRDEVGITELSLERNKK